MLHAALRAGTDGLTQFTRPDLPLTDRFPVAAVDVPLPPGPRGAALAEVAALEALAESGLAPAALGLAVGSCTGGMRGSEARYLTHGPEHRDRRYLDHPVGRLAERLQRRLGLGGTSTTHSEACASAACAIAEAMEWIRAGLVPAMLVVGVDPLTRLTLAGFASLQVIDPIGCRPFTEQRAGMSLGEGAVAFVLEDASFARARGARPIASLLGWGVQAEGHHGTAPEPSGRWLAKAITAALADAQVQAIEIGCVIAHGTGTRDNDACEAQALSGVFGRVPVSSVKRTVGHTMGAAAAFNLAAACWAVRDDHLIASAGGDGDIIAGLDLVRAARPAAVELAVATSLAFGGVDAALVIGKAERCL